MTNTNSLSQYFDKTFGNNGITWIEHIDTPIGFIFGLTVGPDQKLLIEGVSRNDFYVGRLNSDGTIDPSFNDHGFITGEFREGLYSGGENINILGNGEMLLAGTYQECERFCPARRGLALLDQYGQPVKSFGESGTTVVHPNSLSTQALTQDTDKSKDSATGQQQTSSIELPDGNFMILSNHEYNSEDVIGILMRVDRQGEIDYTFGGEKGYVSIQYTAHYTHARTIIQLSNGDFAIGGHVGKDDKNLGFIARYSPDGVPVQTFGSKGYVLLDSLGTYDQISALQETVEGNIIGIGSLTDSEYRGLIVCLDKTGRYVPDFNGGTPVVTPAPDALKNLQWLSAAQRADGKIVTLGLTTGENTETVINQFLPNGEPDESFGNSGQVIIKVSDGLDMSLSVAIQQNKIVVAGAAIHPEGYRPYVFRLQG